MQGTKLKVSQAPVIKQPPGPPQVIYYVKPFMLTDVSRFFFVISATENCNNSRSSATDYFVSTAVYIDSAAPNNDDVCSAHASDASTINEWVITSFFVYLWISD